MRCLEAPALEHIDLSLSGNSPPFHSAATYTHERLTCTLGQPPAAWFVSRVRAGGAFARAVKLLLRQHWVLGDVQLEGIGSLVRLQTLELDNCLRVGGRTLRRLPPSITELSLFGEGQIPHIMDEDLAAIATLPLKLLKLDGCAQHLTPRVFNSLASLGSTLKSLVIAGCCGWSETFVTADSLACIGEHFKQLEHLSLAGVGVREFDRHDDAAFDRWMDGFAHLHALAKLQSLNLYECELSDRALAHIGQIASLTNLNLAKHSLVPDLNRITNEGLRSLASLHKLEAIELTACEPKDHYGTGWRDASWLTDEGLGHLVTLAYEHNLTYINIENNVGMFGDGTTALESLEAWCPHGNPGSDFWAHDHYPQGENAQKLLELDALELYEGYLSGLSHSDSE